jgi:4-hydroxymandelate oxidase
MTTKPLREQSRREFLRFLAASPLLHRAAAAAALGLGSLDRATAEGMALIDDPAQAVNVFDFEAVIKETLNPGHFAYMAQGSDDGRTLAANRAAFERIQLRPRRLVDVANVDLSLDLMGQRFDSPIILAPCGAQGAFHPEGEVAVARAARSRNALQVLSTVTNYSVEDVTAARGAPVWYQLYPTQDWNVTRNIIGRAERAGSPVLVFTVDLPARNLEQIARFRRDSNPDCLTCHQPDPVSAWRRKPMFDGVDVTSMQMGIGGLTWAYVDRLKNEVPMKLFVKGIVTSEDARRCLEHGVDGIIVSNHGGRAEESGRASLDSLPEVLDAVGGRIPVLVDGGIRRGTDIFKALALGADAICIGRPYLWGLGAFGQAGVERVLDILTRELRIVMMQTGTTSIGSITRSSLQP